VSWVSASAGPGSEAIPGRAENQFPQRVAGRTGC
jgi:hypothetical protein